MIDYSALQSEVRQLARERGAVLLAHNYQRPEVQDVADFVGDSLGLSREAASTDANIIVFAGVHFMAETAKILSPDKTVLMPEPGAGCPMADMMSAADVVGWRARHRGVPLVTYVNSTAAVKAVTDICCTSANAVQVVRSLGEPEVLFGPDKNLAAWVSSKLPDVSIIAWEGWCPTHDEVTREQLEAAIAEHPDAVVVAHPECRPEVLELADEVLSTSQMLRYAEASDAADILVVTEAGLLHGLAKVAPQKRLHHLRPAMLCPNMKVTTLEKVRDSLAEMHTAIEVPEPVLSEARGAVERMIAVA